MLWPILGSLFFLSALFILILMVLITTKSPFCKRNQRKITLFYLVWFVPYSVFFLFFTGPNDLNYYPPQNSSPYKLPWAKGEKRFVGQGNRSFTSHRGLHYYAWDFMMPNGTPISAARAGRVVEIKDEFDGVGFNSNFIMIEHENGERSGYFHIRRKSALVSTGDLVRQGQPIALSGMVGQTIYPHVHFVVFNQQETESIPISFSDVPGGVPLAGHFYVSGN